MARRVTISTDRRDLFELFEDVVNEKTDKVVIEHRNVAERAVLVRETYVKHLEMLVDTLKRREPPSKPFFLIGSATLLVEPEDVLCDVRRQQIELAAAKRRRL